MRSAAWWVLTALLGTTACDQDAVAPRCVPGTQISCGCGGGIVGFQVCEASGAFGACVCGAGGDASTDDGPAVDAGPVDGPAVDVPLTRDVPAAVDTPTAVDAPLVTDAPPVNDAPPTMDVALAIDAPLPVDRPPVLDVPVDLGSSDAGGAGDAGLVSNGRFQEQRQPWRSDVGTLWEQVPPQCFYRSVVSDGSGGIWAVCDDRFAMHHTDAGWTRAQLNEVLGDPRLRGVASGAGWVAAVGPAGIGLGIRGVWQFSPVQNWVRPANAALGSGEDFYFATDIVYRYSPATGRASGVTQVWPSTGGTVTQLWGTTGNLYIASDRSVRHYDGALGLTATPTGNFLGVAGASPSEVFAITATTLYRLDTFSYALQAQAAPSACASVEYYGLSGAGSTLVLSGRCNGAPAVWRRSGTAWTALAAPPAFVGPFLAHAPEDGAIYATGLGAPAPVYRFVDGAWRSLTELAAPPAQVIAGRSVTDLWLGGNGVSRLGSDDLWHPVAGAEGFTVRALWQSPEGTLFAATTAGGDVTLRRYDASGWRADRTISAATVSTLAGRSASDAYVAVGNEVLRWNGVAWSSLGVAACPASTSVVKVFVAGTRYTFAYCKGPADLALFQHDGTSWTSVPLTGDPVQGGPVAAPSFLLVSGTERLLLQRRDDAGWTSEYVPATGWAGSHALPSTLTWGGPWLSAAPRVLVGGLFTRTRPSGVTVRRSVPTTRLPDDWVVERIDTLHAVYWTDGYDHTSVQPVLWTDGRYVVGAASPARANVPDPLGGRVVRYDLGE